ncbi:L,D-transpeptidase family protein [Sphingomonas alba]|uniref:L,D-transpeptidase family protein n=1 Tax=Sphingomonas alba TaxID=2908208 RepID=A0ABT0RLU6_9SPHN|nr:L,D-transpeptidase family protein [Sphingomonas alba]MCL6683622.1 L,D-transpeptidase family protein [Sphingomonas alba]
MKKLALVLAASGALALCVPFAPVAASFESVEAKEAATDAAALANQDMLEAFGDKSLKAGQYLWRDEPGDGDPRVVISLSDQLAFLYKGSTLVAVSTISSGKPGKDTPTGVFPILEKQRFHKSLKYENAPMPFMQRIDKYGIALHAGHLPGVPASHGCVRLPGEFAAKLFRVTEVGTPVYIGA